jgi:hypothetical protein
MKKATVTYNAPKGDNKVVEMHGHTFFDGQGTEIVLDDDTMTRLQQNACFKVGAVSDHDPSKDDKGKDDTHGKTHR